MKAKDIPELGWTAVHILAETGGLPMSTHTPGHWYISRGMGDAGDIDELWIRSQRRLETTIATVPIVGDDNEVEANARLIAAAPEMYAALKAIYRVAKTASLPGPVHLSIEEVYAARDVLAKAEEGS